MKFSIGYQNNERLKQLILSRKEQVREVYFPWDDFANGRGELCHREAQKQLEMDLKEYATNGIGLDLLLNGNCYGRNSLSRRLFQHVGDTVYFLQNEYNLGTVTTTSPIIAKFLRKNFPELKIRASVNMEIGTIEGMEYLLELFDSFYMKRELNYSVDALEKARDFCHANGKELLLLANSGCLNYCSARTFHDNLVAHQEEIAEMDNSFVFHGMCTEFLSQADKKTEWLRHSNFIRPEDVSFYEKLCDGMKLATRTNYNPVAVVSAYFDGKYHGDLAELTEPAHSEIFRPAIVANDRFPEDFGAKRLACDKQCAKCDYCQKTQQNAMLEINSIIAKEQLC